MRKLFTDRARLVVYVEAGDLNRLTAHARGEGKTVVEWARETLLGELENGNGDAVRRGPAVRVGQRRAVSRLPAAGGAETASECVPVEEHPKVASCQHGRPKGFNCWQCGGLAKVTE